MDEDQFFEMLSNKTRRELLKSIAREPKYLFQLSQEINKSQQSLQRHIQCLLDAGWIVVEEKESSMGPTRKLYHIAKNVNVRVTLTRNSFEFNLVEISLDDERVDAGELLVKEFTSLSHSLKQFIVQTIDDDKIDYSEKIMQLNEILERLTMIERFVLSRKITITGDLTETIGLKLSGDKHRRDREVAYTIYTSKKPIKIDVLQSEINIPREEILKSLETLETKNLLPYNGKLLIKKLMETTNRD